MPRPYNSEPDADTEHPGPKPVPDSGRTVRYKVEPIRIGSVQFLKEGGGEAGVFMLDKDGNRIGKRPDPPVLKTSRRGKSVVGPANADDVDKKILERLTWARQKMEDLPESDAQLPETRKPRKKKSKRKPATKAKKKRTSKLKNKTSKSAKSSKSRNGRLRIKKKRAGRKRKSRDPPEPS